MDISETWKKLDKETLEKPLDGDLNNGKHSRHPVAKLKKNYFIKSIMMAAFVVCFAGLFFYFDPLAIKVALGVLVFAYVIFLVASYSMYKNIRTDGSMDRSLLEVLTSTRNEISRALRFETVTSLLISPVAGAAGYLMGYTVSGASIDKIFDNPAQTGMLLATVMIFTILGYFLGKKLTREGYGRSLEEIGGMIEEMKR